MWLRIGLKKWNEIIKFSWISEILHFPNFFNEFWIFIKMSRNSVIFWIFPRNLDEILSEFRRHLQNSANKISKTPRNLKIHLIIPPKFWMIFFWNFNLINAKICKYCRSRNAVKTAPTLAIGGFHTAEKEPLKNLTWFCSLFQPIPYMWPKLAGSLVPPYVGYISCTETFAETNINQILTLKILT